MRGIVQAGVTNGRYNHVCPSKRKAACGRLLVFLSRTSASRVSAFADRLRLRQSCRPQRRRHRHFLRPVHHPWRRRLDLGCLHSERRSCHPDRRACPSRRAKRPRRWFRSGFPEMIPWKSCHDRLWAAARWRHRGSSVVRSAESDRGTVARHGRDDASPSRDDASRIRHPSRKPRPIRGRCANGSRSDTSRGHAIRPGRSNSVHPHKRRPAPLLCSASPPCR